MPDPATLEAVAARASAVADARKKLNREVAGLRAAIVAADRDGHGRNEIARQAAPGLSRKLTFAALGAADLLTEADEALTAAGYVQHRDYTLISSGAVALASDAGEDTSRPKTARKRLAAGITEVLDRAGIAVDEEWLAGWENAALTRKA